jgi:hypothetical protein
MSTLLEHYIGEPHKNANKAVSYPVRKLNTWI